MELFETSGEAFVSVFISGRSAAGVGEGGGAGEISFAEDFTGGAAGDLEELRVEEEVFGFGEREVSTPEG